MSEIQRINILYMIDSLTNGGTEKQLVQLINNLDTTRFQPHLCTLKPSAGLYEELEIPKACLDFSSFASLSLVGVVRRLAGFIRQHQIRIIQTFFQDPFLLGALVKPLTNARLIGSFRDLGFWRTSAESRKMRLSYPFFDGFIANSQAVKNSFARTDGINPDKIAVIYNGFDTSAIPETQQRQAGGGKPVVGIVANLNRPVKRVQDFIQAAALIRRKRADVSFLVVGGGHLQPEFEALAAQLGIAGCTTFTGMVSNPLSYVSNFNVGVISSETEGFCNAIIEYMACGIPVVATKTGGNIELVEEGVNGFLYDVADVAGLSEAVLCLLEDAAVQAKCGLQNRDKVVANYSMPQMISRHAELYSGFGSRA